MNWLDKLERRFGRFAIRNLMTYIVAMNGIVYALSYSGYGAIVQRQLLLIPQLVLKGEVWRLFTFVFIPPQTSLFWILFTLYFYYMIGNALEHEWGSFRFNVYYFFGMLATIAAAFLTGFTADPIYLNLSLFLAFARIYPDFELLLFFVIPVKVKYLAMLDWAFFALTIVTGLLPEKLFAAISIINYFLFFGKDILTRSRTTRQAYHRRQQFKTVLPKDFTIHKCTICGKTEKTDPKMDFRYCPECEGDYEYCMDHVRNHVHIKKEAVERNETDEG